MTERYRNLALSWLDKASKEKISAIKDRYVLRALVYAVLDVGESIGELQSTLNVTADTVYPEE